MPPPMSWRRRWCFEAAEQRKWRLMRLKPRCSKVLTRYRIGVGASQDVSALSHPKPAWTAGIRASPRFV